MSKKNPQPEDTIEPADTTGPKPPAEPTPAPEISIESLVARLEEAEEARKRALADFANYQRRAVDNEGRALEAGAAGVIRSLLVVLDHIDLALDQDMEQITVDQLQGGVRMARDELVKALRNHGVQRIQPEPGDEMDPNRHQAMLRQPTGDIEENHIVCVMQPGYVMGELVLRPAKVTVAAPTEGGP